MARRAGLNPPMTMVQHLWVKRIARSAASLLLLGLAAQANLNEPFGLPTVAAPEGPLWVTWRKLQSNIQSQQPTIARCRAEPHNCASAAALQFIAIVKEADGHDGLARIGHLNRAVNYAIRSMHATSPSGARTTWTSPLDTLARGAGNCKQFAVLKYAALSDAGFALDDLRLITGRVKSTLDYHTVVAVRDTGRWYILDNRSLALVESRDFTDFEPLYSFDRRGVRQFVLPSRLEAGGWPCSPPQT
jgi:predicted transglutaminase-like cysteine proteinase